MSVNLITLSELHLLLVEPTQVAGLCFLNLCSLFYYFVKYALNKLPSQRFINQISISRVTKVYPNSSNETLKPMRRIYGPIISAFGMRAVNCVIFQVKYISTCKSNEVSRLI